MAKAKRVVKKNQRMLVTLMPGNNDDWVVVMTPCKFRPSDRPRMRKAAAKGQVMTYFAATFEEAAAYRIGYLECQMLEVEGYSEKQEESSDG